MNDERDCPECSGVGSYRDPSGQSIPCPNCRGAGILKDESAYNHLEQVHPVWFGICSDCAGTGCDRCRNSGRQFRTFAREIGYLTRLQPERKPIARQAAPAKERKEA